MELDRAGRAPVSPELTLPGARTMFIVGDLALVQDEDGQARAGAGARGDAGGQARREEHPPPVAGKPMKPFQYWDRGSFAVIGRNSAVGVALRKSLKMAGYDAWLAWLFIHITFLVGFRSRLAVLLDWGYSYLFFKKSARIITGPAAETPRGPPYPPESPGPREAALGRGRCEEPRPRRCTEPASPAEGRAAQGSSGARGLGRR